MQTRMNNISRQPVSFLSLALLIILCCFILTVPFAHKFAIKLLFISSAVLWMATNILKYKRNFFNGFFPAGPLNKVIFIFYLIAAVSIFFSISPAHSQRVFFERYIPYLILFGIGQGILKDNRKYFIAFYCAILFSSLYFSVGGISDFLRFGFVDLGNRVCTVFQKVVDFAFYVSIFTAFNITVFLFSRNKILKISSLTVCILLYICLVLNASRIAWFAILISVIFITLLKKRFKTFILIVLTITALTVFLPHIYNRVKTIPYPEQWSDRVPLFKSAIAIFKDNPVIGTGIGTYEIALYDKKYYIHGIHDLPQKMHFHAHNTYLELMSETGLSGIVSFCLIFGCFFLLAFKTAGSRSPYPQDEEAFSLGLVSLILAALIFALGSSIITVGMDSSAYFWFIFGMAAFYLADRKPLTKQ